MRQRIDANPADLQVVIDALRGRIPGEAEVLVFGSRAKWSAKHHSDLDLCIRATRRIPRSDYLDIKEALEQSDLPWRVDIVEWVDLEPTFQQIILREGVPLELGHMPSGWRKAKWGEIISLEYGKAIRGYQEALAPFRVFGSNGPIGWTKEPLTNGPGVILGRKGAYRGVHFSADPFYVIDTAYFVKPKFDLDMRWLYYAIIFHKLGEIDDGSPIPSTTRAAVYVRDVEVPPVYEQRAIAVTLGALDDKIELNREMNTTLDAMARALFRDWFVDFGPTRAKIAGAAPYLSPDLWSLFPDRLDDEGKPEGWEAGEMSDLFTLQRGFDLPSQDRRDGTYPILAASGPSGFHDTPMVKGPGVTTGRSGVLGRVFYVHSDFWPLNTSLWVKDYKRATPLYAYHFLSLIDLKGFNAGSAVPTLNRNHIHGLPAVLPPRELIVAFNRLADSLMKRHRQNEAENETLAQTRDLLLPRLMSGELRVAEAERLAMEVA